MSDSSTRSAQSPFQETTVFTHFEIDPRFTHAEQRARFDGVRRWRMPRPVARSRPRVRGKDYVTAA